MSMRTSDWFVVILIIWFVKVTGDSEIVSSDMNSVGNVVIGVFLEVEDISPLEVFLLFVVVFIRTDVINDVDAAKHAITASNHADRI